jgi:hypothetical protein
MSFNYIPDDEDDEDMFIEGLFEEKVLTLTRNEALYLSDSITLIVDMRPDNASPGQVSTPARHLMASAVVPVPVYLVQKIGMAVLESTDPTNEKQTADIDISVADLYILRECCQSYIKINAEPVGYNLLRKVYALMLEEEIREQTEWTFIDDLTKGLDLSLAVPNKATDQKKEEN